MSFNFDLMWKRSVTQASLLLCLLAAVASTQTSNDRPVKLSVKTTSSVIVAGARVELEVVLQNTNNQAVKASKYFPLEIEIRQPSGKAENMSATIKTGGNAAKFQAQLNEPGLVKIYARHRELLEGSAFISVRPTFKLKQIPKPTPKLAIKQEPTAFSLAPLTIGLGVGVGFDQVAPVMQLVSLATTPAPTPFPAGSQGSPKPLLTLCCSSQRRILADGKDEARIMLFLAEPIATELRVHLTSSGGKLDPEVVVIPPAEPYGEARLTNDQPGPVTVKVQNSTPRVDLKTDEELKLSFAPPITKLDLQASPRKIYQGDRSDLIVLLKDEHDRPVMTDEARQISLTIESGRGEIGPKDFTIQPGNAGERASFTPVASGKVVVAAWASSLEVDREELEVDRATMLLIWSGIGGLLGGLLAFWSRSLKWWRLPMGSVTGLVFYWSATFVLLPLLPRVAVVNSWGAFAISVIGGWLGTKVFTLFLRRVRPPAS